jgi:hypothetical protein
MREGKEKDDMDRTGEKAKKRMIWRGQEKGMTWRGQEKGKKMMT